MSAIKYFEPLNLYKTETGNIVAKSATRITPLPKKIPDFIEELKEMNRQFLINIKTGGPLKNYAREFIDNYPFSAKDKQYIEKEVFGLPREVSSENNEKFKTLVNTLYFPLDTANISKNRFITDNSSNVNLWSDEKWRNFKIQHVFPHFISKNFHNDLNEENCFTVTFHKKNDDTLESVKSFEFVRNKIIPFIKDLVYNPKKTTTISPPTTPIITPSPAATPHAIVAISAISIAAPPPDPINWKWNEDEYKRLGIPGKKIYEIKKYARVSSSDDIFWVPLILNEQRKCFQIGHFIITESKFDLQNNQANIIALVGFNHSDMKINTSYFISLFETSYFFYILSMIDKTLNASLTTLLATNNKTELDTFRRVYFPRKV